MKQQLKIVFPRNGQKLPHRYSVKGLIRSPEKLPIQVFVLSNDDLWYPQKDVQQKAVAWQGSTCFGFPDAPEGFGYTIVALAGAEKVTEPSVPVLPTAKLTSQRVKVFRR
jgi:hypothetical protein